MKVLAPAFYALNDSRTPMLVSLASIAINYFAASTLVKQPGLGHAGLALSTSVVALFAFVVLLWRMRARIGGVHGRALAVSIAKIGLASALMGAACAASSHFVRNSLGTARPARLADLALSASLGLAVFYATARVLRSAELDLAWSALARPLARRLGIVRATLQ